MQTPDTDGSVAIVGKGDIDDAYMSIDEALKALIQQRKHLKVYFAAENSPRIECNCSDCSSNISTL